MTDIFTKKKRSDIMSKVRNKGTDIELRLRKSLFNQKLRFRVKTKVVGRPDIVFPKKKIAVFCDGDFWHGKNYFKEKKGYEKFWKDKIKDNILRDKKVNSLLKSQGWLVLRFWETEITKDIEKCVYEIKKAVESINH